MSLTVKNPSPAELESTLTSLADALFEHRRRRVPHSDPFGGFQAYCGDLEKSEARAIVDDPVDYSFRRGMRSAAKVALRLYGREALRDMVERICFDSRGRPTPRTGLLDSALYGMNVVAE